MNNSFNVLKTTSGIILTFAVSVFAIVYMANYWHARYMVDGKSIDIVNNCMEETSADTVKKYNMDGDVVGIVNVPATKTVEQCVALGRSIKSLQ